MACLPACAWWLVIYHLLPPLITLSVSYASWFLISVGGCHWFESPLHFWSASLSHWHHWAILCDLFWFYRFISSHLVTIPSLLVVPVHFTVGGLVWWWILYVWLLQMKVERLSAHSLYHILVLCIILCKCKACFHGDEASLALLVIYSNVLLPPWKIFAEFLVIIWKVSLLTHFYCYSDIYFIITAVSLLLQETFLVLTTQVFLVVSETFL